jgi:RNA polymerase sigma-70 factor (ECF subfamily)
MATSNVAVLSRGYFGAASERAMVDGDSQLDAFLAEVEQRAYRMARFAIGDADEALDITQDAMIRLVTRYADRPPGEWRALFYRILQNRIRDHQRRSGVRQRVMAWLPGPTAEERGTDPIQAAPDLSPGVRPDQQLESDDIGAALEVALAALPPRQQQVFMLRAWEGLDVATTAVAMGCSEGSVKTHYFRAVHALRARLGDLFDE